MTTTVVRATPALGPAAVLWLAATKASAPAYASGWQSAVVEGADVSCGDEGFGAGLRVGMAIWLWSRQ